MEIMSSQPNAQEREDALVWGAPLVIFPALAAVPVAISLFVSPIFLHARLVGVLIVPLIAISEISGLTRLARCFGSDFDVLSLLAGGVVFLLVVVVVCGGVLLGLMTFRL